MRLARRDTFRDAEFLCTMPFWAARISSGCAARSASAAAPRSPDAIASSTLRTKVRMRLRRPRFTMVRVAILRVIFLADLVLAMGTPSFTFADARRRRRATEQDRLWVNETQEPARGRGLAKAGL